MVKVDGQAHRARMQVVKKRLSRWIETKLQQHKQGHEYRWFIEHRTRRQDKLEFEVRVEGEKWEGSWTCSHRDVVLV